MRFPLRGRSPLPEADLPFESVRLQTGVTLHHRRDRRFHTERVRVSFRSPLDERCAARRMFAEICARGTPLHPTRRALAARLADLWGAGYGVGTERALGRHLLRFGANSVLGKALPGNPKTLPELFAFLGDAMTGPAVADEELFVAAFERERVLMERELAARSNDKSRWAIIRAREECLGASHPLALPATGRAASIAALTPEAVLAAGRETVQQGEVDIHVVSHATTASVAKLAEKHLGLGKRRKERSVAPELPPIRRRLRRVSESMPLEQSRLVMIWRTDPEALRASPIAARLADMVFGAGPSNRLFRKVREARSLCYDARSALDAWHGELTVMVGLDRERIDEAEGAVREELASLVKGAIETEELETSRRALMSGIAAAEDGASGMMDLDHRRRLAGLNRRSLASLIRTTAAVPAEELSALLKGFRLDTVFRLEEEADSAPAKRKKVAKKKASKKASKKKTSRKVAKKAVRKPVAKSPQTRAAGRGRAGGATR